MSPSATIWWTYVTFGPCQLPAECTTPTTEREAILQAHADALREMAEEGGPRSWAQEHSWLHGYDSEEAARSGDCSYGIGTHHRIA